MAQSALEASQVTVGLLVTGYLLVYLPRIAILLTGLRSRLLRLLFLQLLNVLHLLRTQLRGRYIILIQFHVFLRLARQRLLRAERCVQH